jgi:hypothetical protein
LASFPSSSSVLFCFFPSRLDKRTFPSWLPQEDYGFFFSSWTRGQCAWNKADSALRFICAAECTPAEAEAGQPVPYNICVYSFLTVVIVGSILPQCSHLPPTLWMHFLGSDQQSNKFEIGCFPFYFTRVANTNQ